LWLSAFEKLLWLAVRDRWLAVRDRWLAVRDRWLAVLNVLVDLRVPKNAGNFMAI